MDLIETCKINYCQIQEHLKVSKSTENSFKRQFPNFDPYMIPAYREARQTLGRATILMKAEQGICSAFIEIVGCEEGENCYKKLENPGPIITFRIVQTYLD